MLDPKVKEALLEHGAPFMGALWQAMVYYLKQIPDFLLITFCIVMCFIGIFVTGAFILSYAEKRGTRLLSYLLYKLKQL